MANKFSSPPAGIPVGYTYQSVSLFGLHCPVRGYIHSSDCFAPASGNRNTTGALNNVGTNGYYWSASPNGTNGYYLNFNSSTVNPANNNNRANGFTVRCVKAFISIYKTNR